MFGVVNVYHDRLKLCLCELMVEGMSVVLNVMLSLMGVMSPPHALCTHGGEVMYFGCVCFRGEL